MAEYPNVFSTNLTIGTTSTDPSTLSFGFNATYIRVENTGALALATNFQGNAATASDYALSTGTVIEGTVPQMAGISFFATNTGGSAKTADVLAMG